MVENLCRRYIIVMECVLLLVITRNKLLSNHFLFSPWLYQTQTIQEYGQFKDNLLVLLITTEGRAINTCIPKITIYFILLGINKGSNQKITRRTTGALG